MRLNLLSVSVFATSLLLSSAAGAVTFNFTGKPNTPQSIISQFEAAGDVWENVLVDNITINVNVGYVPMSEGVLGGNLSTFVRTSYSNFKTALESQTGFQGSSISLPPGDSLNMLINLTTDVAGATVWYDSDDDANNKNIRMPRANAKALGLVPGNSATIDCDIDFNDQFNWDFNDNDGITTIFNLDGSVAEEYFSFKTVAVHELGHCLGFSSGIDDLILYANWYSDDKYTYVTPMDVLRRSKQSRDDYGINAVDFSADTRAKLVIWASANSDGGFSTGGTYGDGHQASHWKDNVLMGLTNPIGIMDPNVDPGIARTRTPLDLRLFRAIGYEVANAANVIEEQPGSGAALSASAGERSKEVLARYFIENNRISKPDTNPRGTLYADCWYESYRPRFLKNSGTREIKLTDDECSGLKKALDGSGSERRVNAVDLLPEDSRTDTNASVIRSHGSTTRIEIVGAPGDADSARTILAPGGLTRLPNIDDGGALEALKIFDELSRQGLQ